MPIYNVNLISCCGGLLQSSYTISTNTPVNIGNIVYGGAEVGFGDCYVVSSFYTGGEVLLPFLGTTLVFESCDECAANTDVNWYLVSCYDKITIDSFSPTQYLCFGEIYNVNGQCYEVRGFRQGRGTPTKYLGPLEQYTNCINCVRDNFTYVYPIRDCVTNFTYCVGSNEVLTPGLTYLTYVLSEDPTVQRCGYIEQEILCLEENFAGYITSYGFIDCTTCLGESNKKRELINCIDGSIQVVWASSLYNIDENVFIDILLEDGQIKSCYTIGEETESEITLPIILSYSPNRTCEECVTCNGIYYTWQDCNNPLTTGYSLSYQYFEIGEPFITPTQDGVCKTVTGIYTGTTTDLLAGLPTQDSQDELLNNLGLQGGIRANARVFSEFTNGDILVAGDFTSFNGNNAYYFTKLNNNLSWDSTFQQYQFNGTVLRSIIQPDGKILFGGYFDSYFDGSTTYSVGNIARINPDGTLDSGFFPNTGIAAFNSFCSNTGYQGVFGMDLQPDGKILVGGWFTCYDDGATIYPAAGIIRLNSDGTVDTSFSTGIGFEVPPSTFGPDYARVFEIKVQPDGKILVGGQFTSYNGTPANSLIRLNSNGSIDTTFNIGLGFTNGTEGYADAAVRSINLYDDGRILVVGHFITFNGQPASRLIRLLSDGSVDNSLTSLGFDYWATTSQVQSDGKIIVGGQFSTYDGISYNYLIRLNPNGSIDNDFNIGFGFNNAVNVVYIKNNGEILVGGRFTNYNDNSYNGMIELNQNPAFDTIYSTVSFTDCEECDLNAESVFAGRSDNSWYNGSFDDINLSMIQQPDGKFIFGGWGSYYNPSGENQDGIIRVFPDGTPDYSFAWTGNTFDGDGPSALALQSDGKILAGGWFDGYKNYLSTQLVRLNSDGTPDKTFDVGTSTYKTSVSFGINKFFVQPNNKILVGGGFLSFDKTPVNSLMRLNPDGSIDGSLDTTGYTKGFTRDLPTSSNFNNLPTTQFLLGPKHGRVIQPLNIFFYLTENSYGYVELDGFTGTTELGSKKQRYGNFYTFPSIPTSIKYNSVTDIIYFNANSRIIKVSGSTLEYLGGIYTPVNEVYNFDIDEVNNRLFYFNPNGSEIKVIDLNTDEEITTIGGINYYSNGVLYISSLNRLYVSSNNDITVIDTSTYSIVTTIGGYNFYEMVYNSSTNMIYVGTNIGVVKIDVLTNVISTSINTSAPCTFLAIGSNNRLYANEGSVVARINMLIDTLVDEVNMNDSYKEISFDALSNHYFILSYSNNYYTLITNNDVYAPPFEKTTFVTFDNTPTIQDQIDINYNLKEIYFISSTNNFVSPSLNPGWAISICDYDGLLKDQIIFNYESNGLDFYTISFNSINNNLYIGTKTGLTAFDMVSRTITAEIAIPDVTYYSVFDSINNRIYYTNNDSPAGSVGVINCTTNTLLTQISVQDSPRGIDFNPNNGKLYVCNFLSNTISVIDTATNTVIATITGLTSPTIVKVNKSNNKVYCYDSLSDVRVINSLTDTLSPTIMTLAGSHTTLMTIDYTENKVFCYTSFNTIEIIDSNTDTIVAFYNSYITDSLIYNEETHRLFTLVKPNGFNLASRNIFLYGNTRVYDINYQSDGSMLVVGSFNKYSGISYNNIIKLTSTGAIDTSFVVGSGFGSSDTQYSNIPQAARQIIKQPDGKFIIVGHFQTYDGNTAGAIVRLNPNGSIDNTFITGSGFQGSDAFNSRVNSAVLQPDGKIICVGWFTSYNGTPCNRIARLNPNGTFDTSFVIGDGFDYVVRTSMLDNNGKLMVSGYFSNYDNDFDISYEARLITTSTISQYSLFDFYPCYRDSGCIYQSNTYNPTTIESITYEPISNIGLTIIVDSGEEILDDNVYEIETPFPVTYLCGNYGSVFMSTNSYLTFNAGSTSCCLNLPSDIPGIGLPPPPGGIKGIFISTWGNYDGDDYFDNDSILYRLYTGLTDSGNTFILRFEGSYLNDHITSYNEPNLIFNFKFYKNTPNVIDLIIEKNPYVGQFNPLGGLSDGLDTYLNTFTSSGETAIRITTSPIIKGNIGENPFECGCVGGRNETNECVNVYTTNDLTEYESCEECLDTVYYKATIRKCGTIELRDVLMKLSDITTIFIYGPLFRDGADGDCYELLGACPIPATDLITPYGLFSTCTACVSPSSAGTEYTVCVICEDCCQSGTTATTISPSHPVWTRPDGSSVSLLDAVQLGGMFGLNS